MKKILSLLTLSLIIGIGVINVCLLAVYNGLLVSDFTALAVDFALLPVLLSLLAAFVLPRKSDDAGA